MLLSSLDSAVGEGCWAFVGGCPCACTLFLRCVDGGWRACSLASREEGGGRVCLWVVVGMCILTRSLLLELSFSGVGRADFRDLSGNAITELAATLFNKLTNLWRLYVTLDAAMHALFSS